MAAMAQEVDLPITSVRWGSVIEGGVDREITKFILKNKAQQEVHVITYGATVTAIRTPNKENEIEDVVLGFADINGILIKITSLYKRVFDNLLDRFLFIMSVFKNIKRWLKNCNTNTYFNE